MLATLFVVVGAVAIAIIGCEVVNPAKGLSNAAKSERQGRGTIT